MLPDFPSLKRDVLRQLEAEVEKEMHTRYGLLYQMKRVLMHEGDRMSLGRTDGTTKNIDILEITSKVELPSDEILKMDSSTAKRLVTEAYASIHDQQSRRLFEVMNEAVEESGNKVNAKGSELSQELFLEMLEKVECNPDDMSGFCLVVHPEMAGTLQRKQEEWLQDPAFVEKLTALEHRKRREWVDKESHRKLVD